MKMEQSVPKRRHIKFRRRGITQKKTYRTRRKFEIKNGHWLVSIATEVANPEEKNADHLAPPPPFGLSAEYYPFKRCQVPVGHPVYVALVPLHSVHSLRDYGPASTARVFGMKHSAFCGMFGKWIEEGGCVETRRRNAARSYVCGCVHVICWHWLEE
jgi:hypothetical protein